MPEADKLAVSRNEAARRMGDVSVRTIIRLEKAGKIRTVRCGKRVVIPLTELQRLLEPHSSR